MPSSSPSSSDAPSHEAAIGPIARIVHGSLHAAPRRLRSLRSGSAGALPFAADPTFVKMER